MLQRSILDLILFNIPINDLREYAYSILIVFIDATQIQRGCEPQWGEREIE